MLGGAATSVTSDSELDMPQPITVETEGVGFVYSDGDGLLRTDVVDVNVLQNGGKYRWMAMTAAHVAARPLVTSRMIAGKDDTELHDQMLACQEELRNVGKDADWVTEKLTREMITISAELTERARVSKLEVERVQRENEALENEKKRANEEAAAQAARAVRTRRDSRDRRSSVRTGSPPRRVVRLTRGNRIAADYNQPAREREVNRDDDGESRSPIARRDMQEMRVNAAANLLPRLRVPVKDVEPGSTILVKGLPYTFTEKKTLLLVNSINKQFPDGCFAVSAVNSVYRYNTFSGMAFVMYASPQLANFAVEKLDGLLINGLKLNVCISDREVICDGSNGGLRGASRWGNQLWKCN